MRFKAKALLLFLIFAPSVAHSARCITCESETGAGQANPVIDVHRVDAPSKRIETSFTNGLSVVVDARLGQVIYTKDGVRTTMTVDEAFIRLANGDRKLAAAYVAETLEMLRDPTNVLQFSRVTSTAPGSMSPQIAYNGASTFRCHLTGHCYYVPRFIDLGPPHRRASYGFGYVDMHRRAPPQHSADYTMWNKFRQVACEDAKDYGAAATVTTGGMAESCRRVNSGTRLALCGLGGLVVVHYSNKMAEAAKRCAASYPGPGKW